MPVLATTLARKYAAEPAPSLDYFTDVITAPMRRLLGEQVAANVAACAARPALVAAQVAAAGATATRAAELLAPFAVPGAATESPNGKEH